MSCAVKLGSPPGLVRTCTINHECSVFVPVQFIYDIWHLSRIKILIVISFFGGTTADLWFVSFWNPDSPEDPRRSIPRSEPAPQTRPSRRCWSRRRSPPRSTTTSSRTSTSSPAPARLARLSPRRGNRPPRNWPDVTANLPELHSASARRSAPWEKGGWKFAQVFVSRFL